MLPVYQSSLFYSIPPEYQVTADEIGKRGWREILTQIKVWKAQTLEPAVTQRCIQPVQKFAHTAGFRAFCPHVLTVFDEKVRFFYFFVFHSCGKLS